MLSEVFNRARFAATHAFGRRWRSSLRNIARPCCVPQIPQLTQKIQTRSFNASRKSQEKQAIASDNSSSERGLFGLRGLHSADDFISLAERCMVRCDTIRAELREHLEASSAAGNQPAAQRSHNLLDAMYTLTLLDSISNEVCRVIDAAELCRNVHAEPAFRHSAEEAFRQLSSYISELNADITLYKSACAVLDGPQAAALGEEQRLVALDLRREFEADGIHFGLLAAEGGPQAAQHRETSERLTRLHADMSSRETRFMQAAASDDNALFLIGPFGATLPASTNMSASPSEAIRATRAPELKAFGRQVRQWLGQFAPQDVQTHKQTHRASQKHEGAQSGGVRGMLRSVFAADKKEGVSAAPPAPPPLAPLSDSSSFPDTDGEYAVCTSRKHVSRSLLASLHPTDIRRQVWAGSVAEPRDNRAGLGSLVRARQALATELGYPSFAEKALSNSVAGSEADVWTFLENAAHTLRPFAEKELEQLRRIAHSSGEDLNTWDIPYWSQIQRARATEAGAASAERVGEYFPLHAAVEALMDMTQCLFGLRLRRTHLGRGEHWIAGGGGGGGGNAGEDEGAFKLLLEGPDGSHRGTVYMDLHQRSDKFTGAAHFTVQCGCAHTEDGRIHTAAATAGTRSAAQLPVVALVFNFPAADGGPPLLSLGDLTTLFHEWGHALHSLLSQTTYQHLSGTRGPLDFVEVPSHLIESYATDVRCLQRWARHYHTGKSAPAGLLEEALQAKRSFEALEASTQVLYSMTDQHIFGKRMGSMAGQSDEEIYAHAVRAALSLQTEYTALPIAPLATHSSHNNNNSRFFVRRSAEDLGVAGASHHPALFLPSHSHFVTYGGGYYAYLYAKMCAAQIWNSHFAADPLSRTAGEHLWRNFLQYGVSRKPRNTLSDMLGGPLDPRHYFRGIGLDSQNQI